MNVKFGAWATFAGGPSPPPVVQWDGDCLFSPLGHWPPRSRAIGIAYPLRFTKELEGKGSGESGLASGFQHSLVFFSLLEFFFFSSLLLMFFFITI